MQRMKPKNPYDSFSFRAPSDKTESQQEISMTNIIPVEKAPKPPQPREINYRHTNIAPMHGHAPLVKSVIGPSINDKIARIDQELEVNIKRRIELEKKLEVSIKEQEQQKKREVLMAYNNNQYQNQQKSQQIYQKIEQKASKIDNFLKERVPRVSESTKKSEEKLRELQRNKKILLESEESQEPVTKQKVLLKAVDHFSTKTKPLPVYTLPDQIKIQSLLRKVTFPQVPANLQSLRKQLQNMLALHSPHSDIHYMLMVVHYHLGSHRKVRQHFAELTNFKKYNLRSHWVAAQAQFAAGECESCLLRTEECLNKIEDKYLPRLIYLKARSYDELGNCVNSLVCYNQLIKIKPKISEYYLQRGVIYHRVGYYRQARQDFLAFGILRPDAKQYIQDKILTQSNEYKRKELIGLLARMF